ncbi:polysaccharide biosynthesis C-terminal domain-containing protein [Aquimarina sp. 2201CG5-10]|uniref:oligosaccharide flippase family protein n=1 Tax=Aquimarina callyspongiae TaxID=3098150 RepID=UPI002AB4D1EF|nr:polysaccharide biosynthesis C-terminal domain-containing protein [Aquimarina sp. 2201CG5-10]MDY8135540.1 polysaccharide biosynthesis C-terminal domain-containing protein [Aquimarina sp. 2201CG5-10]
MGVVVNQSVKNVMITCFGFGIGAVNTLFLFTNFMEEQYYGLVSYLISASNLIWPLIAFGTQNTLIKFFSSYSDQKQQNKFLNLMLLLPLVVAIVLGVIGVLMYSFIIEYFDSRNSIAKNYIWTIFILAYALSYFEIFFALAKVKLKSVFGNLMKELFLRVCICILLFLVYFKMLSVEQFIYGLVLAYIIRVLIMSVYAFKLHKIKLTLSLPRNYISVLKYSFLILIAGSVATLLIDLDKTMIERYLPIENVAKYGICAYIASVIIIPSRAMHQITYPLTAKLINEKSYDQLRQLYQKSSLNLFVISGLLFILIICNVHQLFEVIPDEYELFIWVVVLIGSAKLFDNFLGNNNSILYSSDYYRMVLYIGVGMALLTFILNIVFIPVFGVKGAAIATFTAVFCYNLAKLWVVQIKFKMNPFSKNTLTTLIIILVFISGFYFWNFTFHPIINIILKSILIGAVYVLLLFKLKISNDINVLIDRILQKVF